ncbi:MAG: IS6 family transposase [Thermoplasmata archaeon]|nr:IS6 family transposase [Thermoplasmata archaeon]
MAELRGRQPRLEDFFPEAPVFTRTLAELESGSNVQIKTEPGAARSIAAITCGMVVRTELDAARLRRTEDSNDPNFGGFSSDTDDPPTTWIGGRLYQPALNVGIPIRQSLKYRRASAIRQAVGQSRRRKRMTDASDMMSPTEWWTHHKWSDQRTPALAIVARGDQIRELSATTYSVRSQSHPERAYSVTSAGARWECGCDFFQATRFTCIHILAVRYKIGFEDSAPASGTVAPAVPCASCRSASVVRCGVRHNKSGDVPTYLCNDCGARFSGREGFHNRRSDPDKIALALDLYFRGMSVRKIAEHLRQVYSLEISHVTVYRWVAHYGRLAANWMDAQGARTSDRWHIDETVVNVGGENLYLWNVLDHESRFALATHISRGRDLTNTRVPIHKAKRATPDRPADVLTDGMNTYPAAVSKELGRRATPFDDPKLVHGHGSWFSPHRRVPSIRAKESNNRIERFHGTEKERTKVMRAFKTKKGASGLMEGFRVHYNLVKDHQTLGMTPGEAAGMPTGDGFRWRRILTKAATLPRKVTPESGDQSEGSNPANP